MLARGWKSVGLSILYICFWRRQDCFMWKCIIKPSVIMWKWTGGCIFHRYHKRKRASKLPPQRTVFSFSLNKVHIKHPDDTYTALFSVCLEYPPLPPLRGSHWINTRHNCAEPPSMFPLRPTRNVLSNKAGGQKTQTTLCPAFTSPCIATVYRATPGALSLSPHLLQDWVAD